MLYIILALAALAVWTFVQWETLSLRLFVREGASVAGAVVGATPEVVRTTTKVVKATNARAELELKTAGLDGPVGFREGRVVAAKATRDFLSEVNASATKELKDSLAALEALKTKQS